MLLKIEGSDDLSGQIYRAIQRAILSGHLKGGARLPSTRGLARELGVSRNTALRAYERLLAEGYATGTVGSGTYVTSVLPETMLRAERAGQLAERGLGATPQLSAFGRRLHDAALAPYLFGRSYGLRYDFRYGVPAVEEFPHELWRRLLLRRARAVSVRSLDYGEEAGYGPLREALAEYLQHARGVVCHPAQVLIVNGSQQALDLATRVLLEPGDGVVIEEPHYPAAYRVFAAAGARLIPGPVDAEGLNAAALPKWS